MKKLFSSLLICSIMLSGCGGDSGTSSNFSNNGGPTTIQPFLYSEVRVVSRIKTATVRLEDMGGNEFARGTPDANGFVYFKNLAVPREFRAVSRIGQAELRLDVSDFDRYPAVMRVSILSTLQSLYRQSHPERSRQEIDRRLRVALHLPPTLDLGVSLFEPNPVFSDLAFLREGARRGDWQAFLQSTIEDAEAGRSHIYILTEEALTTPLTGLASGLEVQTLEVARQTLQKNMRFENVSNSRSQRVLVPFISLVAGPASLAGQFLLGVGTGVTGNLVGGITKGVFGWAANQMGLNYGTGDQLKEIQQTLDQVLTVLTGLAKTQASSTLESQFRTVADILTPVQTATTSLNTQAQAALAPNSSSAITNVPFTPVSGVTNLITAITTPNFANILTQTQTSLSGAGNPLLGVLAFQMTDTLGIDQPASMNGCPWNTSIILDTVLEPYNFFAGAQVNALNLYSEQAHNSAINPDPVVGVQQLLPNFRTATQKLKAQRQQLPLVPSAQIMLDMENGIHWYNEVFAASSFLNASQAAESWHFQMVFPDGSTAIYDDWRLPTIGEVTALQARGTYNPTWDSSVLTNSNNNYPDIGRSASGLTALGFNGVNQLNSDGSIWFQIWTDGAASGLFAGTGTIYELNHQGGNVKSESSNQNYVWVRTFGDQSQGAIVSPTGAGYSPVPTLPVISGYTPLQTYGVQGRPLLPGEIAQWGVCTSITNLQVVPAPSNVTIPPVNSQSSPTTIPLPTGSLKLQATLNYTLTLGGSFTLGTSSNFQVTNGPNGSPVVYQASVTTAPAAPVNGVTYPNLLQEWVSWDAVNAQGQSDTSIVEVLNLPGLDGIFIPFQTQPTTLTANVLGAAAGTLNYTPSAAAPHTLQSLQISPRNIEFGATTSFPANGNFPIFCTGFYSDRTMESLAGQVTWTVTPANNPGNIGVVSTGATTATLQIASTPGQPPYTVNVTATMGSLSDTTQFEILSSNTSQIPVVNLVIPSSAASGARVTLTGSNLLNASEVTVNGVSVNFFASTESQLSIDAMPPGTSGQIVPIVVTSPGGSSSPVNFRYE